MSERNPKTFKETPLSDDDRRAIVSALKEEGFSEEQLDSMAFERVWRLYINSVKEIMSCEISKLARDFERNPQLASALSPLIERISQQLGHMADSLERELDKKERKEGKP